eukprot:932593-Prymnesium_polylepis.1
MARVGLPDYIRARRARGARFGWCGSRVPRPARRAQPDVAMSAASAPPAVRRVRVAGDSVRGWWIA